MYRIFKYYISMNILVATTQHATARYTSRRQAHDHRYSQLQGYNIQRQCILYTSIEQASNHRYNGLKSTTRSNKPNTSTQHKFFSQICLPVVYQFFHQCQPIENQRLNIFSCGLKTSSIKETVVSLSSPFYTLHTLVEPILYAILPIFMLRFYSSHPCGLLLTPSCLSRSPC